jgi:DNA-binding NarL/FixJ family response regulator
MRACAGAGLVEAIRRVAAGEDLLDHARTDRLKERWSQPPDVDPRWKQLTPQERRILDHVADGLTNR